MSDAFMPHCDVCHQPEYACTCNEENERDIIIEHQVLIRVHRGGIFTPVEW